MEVLIFDLLGKMAHFRKYYTNSSSLTYYFPPRTTIIGIIAGIIGIPKNEYHDLFSSENSRIAVSIKTPVRKLQQTVNYIWAENIKQLNASKGQHTQIPLEILLPAQSDFLRYRIFFWHKDESIFNNVIESIQEHKYIFPPYLGISEFIGDTEFVDVVEVEEFKDEEVGVDSVVNLDYIAKGGRIVIDNKRERKYVKEKMPVELNNDRTLRISTKEYIVELEKGKIFLETDETIYKVKHRKGEENILFMVKK